jgi:hypothetical protein
MKAVEVTRLLPVVKALKGFEADVPNMLPMLLVENALDGMASELLKAFPMTPWDAARLDDSCELLASATEVPNTLLPRLEVENAEVGTENTFDGSACDVLNKPATLLVEKALLGWACEVPKTLAMLPVLNARLAACCALLAVASDVPNTLPPMFVVDIPMVGVLNWLEASAFDWPNMPATLPAENAELIPAVAVPKVPAVLTPFPVVPALLPLVLPVPASAAQIAMPVNVAMIINAVTAKRILLLTIL